MKFIFIGLSFFFCGILLSGCIAEGMAAPDGAIPMWMVLDRTLAGVCLLCCFLAFWKNLPAAIFSWVAVVLRICVNWKYAPAGHLMAGIAGYAIAVALCLTCVVFISRSAKQVMAARDSGSE
jgi:hypothetical protein